MSEFRQDPISRDWVIIAPGRAKRPDELVRNRPPRAERRPAEEGCPFEDLIKSGNYPPIMTYPDVSRWDIVVLPNKYPAVVHGKGHAKDAYTGIYRSKPGVGAHELVITRSHDKGFADLSSKTIQKLFEIFRERFEVMIADPCCEYVSVFMNWGPAAGASIWHPHYQILALPIIPPHIAHSLHGAETYFKKNGRCVRCEIIREDRKAKTRIIAENEHAIAVTPYASKRPFEISVLPKKHFTAFEKTPPEVLAGIAQLTQAVLKNMRKRLNDPDFNFYIHSAPTNGKEYPYHHWHIEIIPIDVVSPPGGFEISTVVNINVIDPDVAAKILRK